MELSATECSPGDRFTTRGKTWTHCGHTTAVRHVCAEAEDGEQTIISAHETVERVHIGTADEAAEALSRPPRKK